MDADDYRELREESKERRYRNRTQAQLLLTARYIKFDVRNDGAHLVVRHKDLVVDFWPGTGKWIVRDSQNSSFKHPNFKSFSMRDGWSGRGIFNLIKAIGF